MKIVGFAEDVWESLRGKETKNIRIKGFLFEEKRRKLSNIF
jgi:hypothetical protein